MIYFFVGFVYIEVENEDFTAGNIDLPFLMLPFFFAIAPLSVYAILQCVFASSVNSACWLYNYPGPSVSCILNWKAYFHLMKIYISSAHSFLLSHHTRVTEAKIKLVIYGTSLSHTYLTNAFCFVKSFDTMWLPYNSISTSIFVLFSLDTKFILTPSLALNSYDEAIFLPQTSDYLQRGIVFFCLIWNLERISNLNKCVTPTTNLIKFRKF